MATQSREPTVAEEQEGGLLTAEQAAISASERELRTIDEATEGK
jgi:hypothetical protein